MTGPSPVKSKRPRDKYSRLVCLGCCKRRIRCELPKETEIPKPGQLHRVRTPCYRCRRLDIPCLVRQTVLGRPNANGQPTASTDLALAKLSNNRSCVIIELPIKTAIHGHPLLTQDGTPLVNRSFYPEARSCSADRLPCSERDLARCYKSTLSVHVPQSTETLMIIRAVDTLRYEKVENEWFRHLPAHVGHTRALDLSIKAIVAACTYSRGLPGLSSEACYQALALALSAVREAVKEANEVPSDDILAATALLVPFEGAIKKHGIPTRLHIEGLAAMLRVRPTVYPVTDLAREILDFHVCESAILSCVQDKPSPFETVAREYFASGGSASSNSDQGQLKALSIELFIRIPRLVTLIRKLRYQPLPRDQCLLEAIELSNSLSRLQDSEAERRLLQGVSFHTVSESRTTSPIRRRLHFASVKDFEVVSYYWQSRLFLLRLQRQLHQIFVSKDARFDALYRPGMFLPTSSGPGDGEISRLVQSNLMCLEYIRTLPLRKHVHLVAHAMLMVWGAVRDVPLATGHDKDAQESESMRGCLLQAMNIALEVEPHFKAEDMDIAADIFVGGWPTGRFAKLYGL